MRAVRPREIESWVDEKEAGYLYGVLAEVEAGTPREALFRGLLGAADKQAAIWAEAAREGGLALPEPFSPSVRARIVGRMVRALGPRRCLRILSAMKVRGMSVYTQTAEGGHAMPLRAEDVGRRHKGVGGGGALRAGVFGVNDGLVSNTSLILGVAGASGDSKVVVLSGVAGLLAGAFSMAAGEYISVRSQREVLEYQIGLEREELAKYPKEEAAELALIYEARGVPKEEAEALGARMIADPAHALSTLAREELGLDPDDLASPWQAALSSFVSFALGALLPLAPFLLIKGGAALITSAGLAAAALFAVGALLSLFTGRSAVLSGLRMLLIGGAAGGATYLIGKVLGVSLS
jgi:VIT1/CCC1 family predicted Fe2+/Mn2+ transporter